MPSPGSRWVAAGGLAAFVLLWSVLAGGCIGVGGSGRTPSVPESSFFDEALLGECRRISLSVEGVGASFPSHGGGDEGGPPAGGPAPRWREDPWSDMWAALGFDSNPRDAVKVLALEVLGALSRARPLGEPREGLEPPGDAAGGECRAGGSLSVELPTAGLRRWYGLHLPPPDPRVVRRLESLVAGRVESLDVRVRFVLRSGGWTLEYVSGGPHPFLPMVYCYRILRYAGRRERVCVALVERDFIRSSLLLCAAVRVFGFESEVRDEGGNTGTAGQR